MGRWEMLADSGDGERLPVQASLDAAKTREEVRRLRAEGHEVKTIAKRLDVSERTVYRHLRDEAQ
jgi:DNA-binding NarL/FixJ family response regulator